MRQRGDAFLVYAAVIGVAVAALVAGVSWIHHNGYTAGAADKQMEWDKQKQADAALESAQRTAVARALLLAEKGRLAAEAAAIENKRKWQEALRESHGKQLAACEAGTPSDVRPNGAVAVEGAGIRAPSASGDRPAAPLVRLYWRAVGLHDGAFTDLEGKPLFGAATEFALAPERADTASRYGLEDLIAVDGENAERFSKCRRDLNSVIDKVNSAAAAWDKAHP